MTPRLALRRLTGGSCFGLFLALLTPVRAEIPLELMEKLEAQIAVELGNAYNEFVTPEKVAIELGFPWPLDMPAKGIDGLELEIQNITTAEADKKFPETLADSYEQEAKELYRPLEVGSFVSLTRKSGDTIEGYLRELSKTELKIDNTNIPLAEFGDDELAHFDTVIRKLKVKEYVRAKMATLKEQRSAYQAQIRDDVSRNLYRDSGYILVDKEWMALRAFVDRTVAQRREQLAATLKPKAQIKVYYENDLEFYEEQWMTKEAAREKRRLKELALEEQKRQEELQKKNEMERQTEQEEDTGDGSLWE